MLRRSSNQLERLREMSNPNCPRCGTGRDTNELPTSLLCLAWYTEALHKSKLLKEFGILPPTPDPSVKGGVFSIWNSLRLATQATQDLSIPKKSSEAS